MTYLGIDPGLTGGIAVINSIETEVHPMPKDFNKEELVAYLRKWVAIDCKVIIEKQFLKPCFVNKPCYKCHAPNKTAILQKGVMTSLTNYGIIIGILISLEIPYEEVESAKWKKYFKLSSDKKLSIKKAKELFPHLANTIKNHDGMAEALLIGDYGRRLL